MKSYTDLEQSKKLADILPLESADMTLPFRHTKDNKYFPGCVTARSYIDVYNEMIALPGMDKEEICKLIQPCWSLAALLDVLPSVIKRNGKRMFLTMEKAGAYNLYYKSTDRLDELWETKEEPIDAYVDMIELLHELNLL